MVKLRAGFNLESQGMEQVGQKLFMGRKVQHMFSCETEIIHGKR